MRWIFIHLIAKMKDSPMIALENVFELKLVCDICSDTSFHHTAVTKESVYSQAIHSGWALIDLGPSDNNNGAICPQCIRIAFTPTKSKKKKSP